MVERIRSVRGMHDALVDVTPHWQFVETIIKQVVTSYGYQEIRLPIIEKAELFSRSIGEVTDIVEKEMYTFTDRNGDALALRPEGTAGCVRAIMQHGTINQIQRLWYMGPMFRHERPQKGRYRQFHQFGVEVYGLDTPDIDAELMLMTNRILKELGLKRITLQINSLGSLEERLSYRELLLAHFKAHYDALDESSQQRLYKNPLRILDSKHPDVRAVNEAAPKLIEHLNNDSRQAFDALCQRLDAAGISYEVNPRLVRGLDYYGQTVFEWVTDKLGSQDAICAGGRYDDLLTQLGASNRAAIGFAMGIERLIALLEEVSMLPESSALDVCIIAVGESAAKKALMITEKLHDQLPSLKVLSHCSSGNFKSQFKQADRSGSRWALILGEDEINQQVVGVKTMATGEQESVSWDRLTQYLKNKAGL